MTIKLHTGLGSGNSYKVELMLHLLSVPYEPINVSIPNGEHRDPGFPANRPVGRGRFLAGRYV